MLVVCQVVKKLKTLKPTEKENKKQKLLLKPKMLITRNRCSMVTKYKTLDNVQQIKKIAIESKTKSYRSNAKKTTLQEFGKKIVGLIVNKTQ